MKPSGKYHPLLLLKLMRQKCCGMWSRSHRNISVGAGITQHKLGLNALTSSEVQIIHSCGLCHASWWGMALAHRHGPGWSSGLVTSESHPSLSVNLSARQNLSLWNKCFSLFVAAFFHPLSSHVFTLLTYTNIHMLCQKIKENYHSCLKRETRRAFMFLMFYAVVTAFDIVPWEDLPIIMTKSTFLLFCRLFRSHLEL